MAGLSSIGIYLPRTRLDRSLIASAWGSRQSAGERTVANFDEDALTMGVEAAHRCLGAFDPLAFDGLYFASTSAPYREKQVASVIATACDFMREISTADFTGSVRAGIAAVAAAVRAVEGGAARRILVVVADARPAEPDGELEGLFGDGAVALVVDRDGKLAEFVGSSAVAEEFTFQWRRDDGTAVQVQDQKFALSHGVLRDLEEVVGRVINEHGVGADELGTLAVATPDARSATRLAKALALDPATQLVPDCISEVGVLGCPDPFLLLAKGLESAAADSTIAVAAHGEGAEALLFRVTDANAKSRVAPAVDDAIARRIALPSYEKYLKYRRILGRDDTPVELISNVLEARELQQDTRLYGTRCGGCGMVQYPQARVCLECNARDGLDDQKLTKRGKIFTFTVDHLAANLEHPMGMVVVDLEGGGRVYVQMTDATPDEVQIGAEVVLTYRRLHAGGENYNYFWKARPA